MKALTAMHGLSDIRQIRNELLDQLDGDFELPTDVAAGQESQRDFKISTVRITVHNLVVPHPLKGSSNASEEVRHSGATRVPLPWTGFLKALVGRPAEYQASLLFISLLSQTRSLFSCMHVRFSNLVCPWLVCYVCHFDDFGLSIHRQGHTRQSFL